VIIKDLMKYKNHIEERKEAFIPDIRWDGSKRKSKPLSPSPQD